MVKTSQWVVAAALGLILIAVGSASAQDAGAAEGPAGWAYELPNLLMSPFCPGKTLADCTSPQAESLRMWIVVQESAGRTQADVEDELLERYGDVLRPAPRATGFGITAYAVPLLAFLFGGVLVAVFLRRQTRSSPPRSTAPEAGSADPELERIIDEQLTG